MERLLNIMRERNLDGYYISRPVNVNYISHYTGADSFLFITEGEKFFLTDPRYTEQAAMECPDYTIADCFRLWLTGESSRRSGSEVPVQSHWL